MPSVKQSCNHTAGSASETKQMQALMEAFRADLAALHTSVKAVTAKLDADATVTDTDYASTCDPADMTVEP